MFTFISKLNHFMKPCTRNRVQCSRMFGSGTKVDLLPNGLKVATREMDTSMFCASFFIQSGSRYENQCNNGISHFFERVVLSSKDFEESAANSCIRIESITTREYQMFSAACPVENTSECIQTLFKMMFQFDLHDRHIKLQKDKYYFDAVEHDKNPKALVFDYLHQTAFQGTPLGQSVIGSAENITAFNINWILKFKEVIFDPHRFLLVMCGRVPHDTLVCKVQSHLHMMGEENCHKSGECLQRFTGSQIIYRDDSMSHAHVAIAVEAPGNNSFEYLPFLVASNLIGSWHRTQGGCMNNGLPLARAASTSLLCENFDSFYISYHDVGLWGIYFIGGRMGLDDMVSNIQDQWMHLCVTIGESDVQRAINLLKLKLAKKMTGVINSCHDIGSRLSYKSDGKTSFELYCELSKVTDKMVREVAFKYIYDRCPVVAGVGPTETLSHYNRIKSGMYWLRL